MGMTQDLSRRGVHPAGEQPLIAGGGPPLAVVVDSFAGAVRVEWDHRAAFTPLGQLPFFIVSVASDMSGLGSAWFVRFLNREITCCRRFGWRVYWMRYGCIEQDD